MTEPTDDELDAVIAKYRTRIYPQDMHPRFERAIMRAAIAKWGVLRAENIVIPTDTMEQEFQKHYQRGYEAGKKAATPQPTQAQSGAVPLYTVPQPCPTCIALARTVMLDQVSFDRKPDCYGIRQITDDEGVEEWEDIRTSPDVAREEANDMMATGRGEIYEVVPLWTTPQPTQAQAGAVPLTDDQRCRIVLTAYTVGEAIDMVERHHGIKGGQHGTS